MQIQHEKKTPMHQPHLLTIFFLSKTSLQVWFSENITLYGAELQNRILVMDRNNSDKVKLIGGFLAIST